MQSTLQRKGFVQKLGVDYKLFVPTTQLDAQTLLGIELGKYALFSDVSNTLIKRRDIAEAIIKELGGEYMLLVMCGVSPNIVPKYINACEFVLLTSDEEGSPNIIREALSLNKRVFCVDVGDAKKQLEGLRNSCIISRNPKEAAIIIRELLGETYTDNTRQTKGDVLNFASCCQNELNLYETLINN